MSAFRPIASASPPEADVPGGVSRLPLLTQPGHFSGQRNSVAGSFLIAGSPGQRNVLPHLPAGCGIRENLSVQHRHDFTAPNGFVDRTPVHPIADH